MRNQKMRQAGVQEELHIQNSNKTREQGYQRHSDTRVHVGDKASNGRALSQRSPTTTSIHPSLNCYPRLAPRTFLRCFALLFFCVLLFQRRVVSLLLVSCAAFRRTLRMTSSVCLVRLFVCPSIRTCAAFHFPCSFCSAVTDNGHGQHVQVEQERRRRNCCRGYRV